MSLPICVFGTTGSEYLAEGICTYLQQHPLNGDTDVLNPKVENNRFANGNILPKLPGSLRLCTAVVVHTQTESANDRLVELLLLLDAIKHAKPNKILLVMPYMPYVRSDKRDQPRIGHGAKLIAELLETAMGSQGGVILLDPHGESVPGYFRDGADTVTAIPMLIKHFQETYLTTHPQNNLKIVFADEGEDHRHGKMFHQLGLPMGRIDKRRVGNDDKPKAVGINIDVRGCPCIVVDDEIASGATLEEASNMILLCGGIPEAVLVVHPVTEPAAKAKMILKSLPFQHFFITNSVPVQEKFGDDPRFSIIPVTPLLGEAVRRELVGGSLSELREHENVAVYYSIPV